MRLATCLASQWAVNGSCYCFIFIQKEEKRLALISSPALGKLLSSRTATSRLHQSLDLRPSYHTSYRILHLNYIYKDSTSNKLTYLGPSG